MQIREKKFEMVNWGFVWLVVWVCLFVCTFGFVLSSQNEHCKEILSLWECFCLRRSPSKCLIL